jgi:hypothetical protein
MRKWILQYRATTYIGGVNTRRTKSPAMSKAAMREHIHSCRGNYKPKPGEKSGLEILMEERAKDKVREEAKIQRWLGGRRQGLV